MHSSMIGKVEKAMRYAHEPDRVKLQRFERQLLRRQRHPHRLARRRSWHCDCHLFEAAGGCSHTLAVQKMLDPMLTDAARETPLYGTREEVADPGLIRAERTAVASASIGPYQPKTATGAAAERPAGKWRSR